MGDKAYAPAYTFRGALLWRSRRVQKITRYKIIIRVETLLILPQAKEIKENLQIGCARFLS